jgi:hypothetical protein
MAWPRATDYSDAVQNPSACFADGELAGGAVATADLLLGLPLSYSGNFATVYKVLGADGQAWAVKCFTRPVEGLRERYHRISRHLEANPRRFAVEFRYLPEGVQVEGAWYPVVKMHWVEGLPLNEFLREHSGAVASVEQLAQLWLRLDAEMRGARMAHGDLQHGNVLLVRGSTENAMALRLVDYDGMWVPDLDGRPPGEVGHPNYQHPQRARDGGYDAEIDRFAHLVIYTALRAVAAGGRELWERYDNGENLLFKEADFQDPAGSELFAELLASPDRQVWALAARLRDACEGPLAAVPRLSEVVGRMAAAAREPAKRHARGVAGPPPVPVASLVEVPDALDDDTAEETPPLGATITDLPPLPPPLPPPVLSPSVRLALAVAGILNHLWPVTMALLVGLVLAALAAWVVWPALRRQSNSPPAAEPPTLPQPGVRLTTIPEPPARRNTTPPAKANPRPRPNVAVTAFALEEVHLRAGGQVRVPVQLIRHRYDGPVTLRLTEAPPGVSAREVEVPRGGKIGLLILEATQTAGGRLGMSGAKVSAVVGGEEVGVGRLILHLDRPFPGPNRWTSGAKAFTD